MRFCTLRDVEDVVAVTDSRISFYAERQWLWYGVTVAEGAEYVVRIVDDQCKEVNPDEPTKVVYSVWVDKRKKSKKKLYD